jgi:hypothetical protein
MTPGAGGAGHCPKRRFLMVPPPGKPAPATAVKPQIEPLPYGDSVSRFRLETHPECAIPAPGVETRSRADHQREGF